MILRIKKFCPISIRICDDRLYPDYPNRTFQKIKYEQIGVPVQRLEIRLGFWGDKRDKRFVFVFKRLK